MTDEQPDKPEDGISDALRREIEALSGDLEEEETEDAKIQRRIDEIREKAETTHVHKGKEIDAEFESRLAELEGRSKAKSAERKATKVNLERERRLDRESARGLGIGLSVAYTIIGLPLVGFGIGYLIDSSTGFQFGKAIFLLLGAILGLAMAVVMLNRYTNNP